MSSLVASVATRVRVDLAGSLGSADLGGAGEVGRGGRTLGGLLGLLARTAHPALGWGVHDVLFGDDSTSDGVVEVSVAERLGFGLLDVEAKCAENNERGDGRESEAHLVYLVYSSLWV